MNENRYLKFLLRLYKMDKNVVYKFRFFEKWCFDFFSNSEKLHYKNFIKKLRRKALDKKKFLNKDKDILEMIFKMTLIIMWTKVILLNFIKFRRFLE